MSIIYIYIYVFDIRNIIGYIDIKYWNCQSSIHVFDIGNII